LVNDIKISIITVCFNSALTIKDTINSVENQNGVDVEHIVIDGLSKDETVNIVKSHESIATLISELDKGIYDAMNKGIALASGNIVGTLNADDFYYDDNVLNEVERVFLDPGIDACYGDLVYVKQEDINQTVRFWKSNDYKDGLFKSGWMPAHPTFFVRKSVYDRLGGFNLNYKIAADFELLFRFIEQNKIKTKYIPKVMVKMRLGGTTNKSLNNVVNQNKEIISILQSYYPNFSIASFMFRKLINRLSQFIRRPKYK
jgi:glycosyltransferase involved in cell wall biosynthesis